MSDVNEEDLAHYGVPGMKWGRRGAGRSSKSGSKKAPTPYQRTSADHKAVIKVKKKPVSAMSNAELKAFTTRVGLEKQYTTLNPGKVAKGRKYVAAALAVGATANEVIKFSKSDAGKAIIKAMKK